MRAMWSAANDATGTAVDHYESIRAAAAHVTDRGRHSVALDAADEALLDYTIRLTIAPRSNTAAHVDALTEAGLSDRDVADIVNVVACFSYMNRLADGLGVRFGDDREAWAVTLLGQSAWREHVAWADQRRCKM